MTRGELFAAFLTPLTLIFISRGKSKVHLQSSEVEEAEEEKVDAVSKEVQTEQVHEFEMKLRSGTLTRMRSSSATL